MTDTRDSEPFWKDAEERPKQLPPADLEKELRAIRELEDDLGEKIYGATSLAELL